MLVSKVLLPCLVWSAQFEERKVPKREEVRLESERGFPASVNFFWNLLLLLGWAKAPRRKDGPSCTAFLCCFTINLFTIMNFIYYCAGDILWRGNTVCCKSEDDCAHILEITFEAKYIYSRKFLSGEKIAVTTYLGGIGLQSRKFFFCLQTSTFSCHTRCHSKNACNMQRTTAQSTTAQRTITDVVLWRHVRDEIFQRRRQLCTSQWLSVIGNS